MISQGLLIFGLIFGTVTAGAAEAPGPDRQASIEALKATITTQVTAKELKVAVKPPNGTDLNFDGPWKLTLTGELPLKDDKVRDFDVKAFNKDSRVFSVALDEKKSQKISPGASYKLTYFLCSTDHTWCKREEASGPVTK